MYLRSFHGKYKYTRTCTGKIRSSVYGHIHVQDIKICVGVCTASFIS